MSFRKSNLYLSLVNSYMIDSPQPSSINYWWNLGSLLGLCLVIQICTGIFLAMHYSSNIELAFSSVEHIMRDVQYGWLLRYMHANGASMFFICMYIHIGKGLYYGSYRSPRIVLWTVGVIIFILTMAAAFLGYIKNNSLTSYININKLSLNLQPLLYLMLGNIKLNKNYRLNIINQKRNYKLLSSVNNYPITDKTLEELLKELNIKLLYAWDNLEDNKVRLNIINTVKNKTGIYIIINKINNKFYIGSSNNKLYTRLCRHLLNLNGNKYLKNSVKLYGLNNFIYGIIEIKDTLQFITSKIIYEELAYLETLYILTLCPQYNILQEAYSSQGYNHTSDTIKKIKDSFLKERRNLLANLLSNRKWLEESKQKLTQFNTTAPSTKGAGENKIVSKDTKDKLSILKSKLIELYDLNNNYLCSFKNISIARHYLCTSEKLISRCLKKGYIYIPNVFIPYLNNKFLNKNNYIKSFINKNDLQFINSRNKITQKKSSIIPYSWNSKFYIKN